MNKVDTLEDLKKAIKHRMLQLDFDNNGYAASKMHIAYEDVITMIDNLLAEEQPAEKKYRRFKYLDELPFNMGEVILYRLKGETGSESKALITEVSYTNDEKCAIYCIGIGNKMLTTHECFADLELYNDECEWQPFGVLDE